MHKREPHRNHQHSLSLYVMKMQRRKVLITLTICRFSSLCVSISTHIVCINTFVYLFIFYSFRFHCFKCSIFNTVEIVQNVNYCYLCSRTQKLPTLFCLIWLRVKNKKKKSEQRLCFICVTNEAKCANLFNNCMKIFVAMSVHMC